MVLSGAFDHCLCFVTFFTAISMLRAFFGEHWCYGALLLLIGMAQLLV